MGRLLSWLGLQSGSEYPNLDALVKELRRAMPDDESVIVRYITVVIALLGKVAYADGHFTDQEEETLRGLLTHIGRLSPGAIEAVCQQLHGKVPSMSEEELDLCYRELKALCDGRERLEVVRLLARLATADGALSPAEHQELARIAEEIGIPISELEAVERETQLPASVPRP